MLSRVSMSWKTFPSWTLRRETETVQLHGDGGQMGGLSTDLKHGSQYLCLWCASARWLNFTRISFALKHTDERKKRMNKHFITQTLQSRNHNADRNMMTQLYTHFSRQEEGSEESPLHIEVCSLREPAKGESTDGAVCEHSRRFSFSQWTS